MKGGRVVKYNLKKLEKELAGRIDKDSQVQREKVARYLSLVATFYDLDKYVEEKGPIVITQNGCQQFIKANPAIQEKNKINMQLLAIEKSFGFGTGEDPPDGSDLV